MTISDRTILFRTGLIIALSGLLFSGGCGLSNNSGESEPPIFCDDGNEPIGSDEFIKPASFHPWEDFRATLRPDGWETNQSGGSQIRVIAARNHMRPLRSVKEHWLYPDEYAVFDLGLWWDEDDHFLPEDPRKFELFIFVDLQPVEFGFIPVDPDPNGDPFPTLEEAKNVTELRRSFPFDVGRNDPTVFTLVIPPESLGEHSAKDVRIIYATRNDPEDGSFFYGRRDRSIDMIINYGATHFARRSEIPALEFDLSQPPQDWDSSLNRLGTFLAPPDTPDQIDFGFENYGSEFMNKVHTVYDNEIFMDAWSRGSGDNVPIHIVPLDGDQMLDEPRGILRLPHAPDRSIEIRSDHYDYAANYTFQAPLRDDDIHTFRIAHLRYPFCREALLRGTESVLSNPVFIRQQ